MAIPFPATDNSINPVVYASNLNYSRAVSEAILRNELQLLTVELDELQKYRDYYDGEQKMVFGTKKFLDEFGPAFPQFRDNWCAPVIEAVADKLYADGLRLGTTDEEMRANAGTAHQIWNVFRENDFDEQQAELYEGALVEGRSYVIVWPDNDPNTDLEVRLDWNRADLIRVRYADDDPRKIIWAMKRWLTPGGETYITVYTPSAIYKYVETARDYTQDVRTGMEAQAPLNSPTLSFSPRRVEDENWPLPNPYGVVPVVEFANKRGSELHDVIPLQDGINYMMLQALSAIGFLGYPQRGFHTGVNEPVGGWSNAPGRVWQVKPDIDPEGNLHYGKEFEFSAGSIDGIRSFIELALQHIALQTKTPVRAFFQSDRGGRGDAPSGESMLIEDQPSIDKAEDRMRRFGNAAFRLAKMVSLMHDDLPDKLPLGELDWRDPRAKYRSALIAEGALMVDKMGMPLKFVVTQLGFTQDEQELLLGAIEEQKAEQEAALEKQNQMALEAQEQKAESAPRDNPPSPQTSRDNQD